MPGVRGHHFFYLGGDKEKQPSAQHVAHHASARHDVSKLPNRWWSSTLLRGGDTKADRLLQSGRGRFFTITPMKVDAGMVPPLLTEKAPDAEFSVKEVRAHPALGLGAGEGKPLFLRKVGPRTYELSRSNEGAVAAKGELVVRAGDRMNVRCA